MITYPLNKIEYQATDAELYNCTRNSGLYSGSDFRPTVSGADNNVAVDIGVGWIRNSKFSGKVVCSKTKTIVDMGLPDSRLPRWDVVCIQFDKNKNATEIVVKKGTAASSPIMPIISQTENLYELYLCKVYRKAGALTISNADLTDLRLDPTVCGLMADSVTSVDTESINQQFTAFLDEFKDKIQDIETSSGIMLASTYDADSNGIVDNAERLGGQLPSYYATKSSVDTAQSAAEKAQQTADNAKANAFSLYTHTAGRLTGSGVNGKFKATVSETVTKLNVNGVSCTIKSGSETQMELIAGCWYTFILDGTTVNFSGGGAGAGLNFKIVGGTTQPVSPKENTIWVNTSTSIGEWQFSSTQPTTRADGSPLQNGDVWIDTSSGRVSIGLIKKNGVIVRIAAVRQYSGSGEWEYKTSKVYVNSKWNELEYIILSPTTNLLTGSWKMSDNQGNRSQGLPSFVDGKLYIKSLDMTYHKVVNDKLFNLTDYNNLYVEVDVNTTPSRTDIGVPVLGVGFTKTLTSGGNWSFPVLTITEKGKQNTGLLKMDISTYQGEYYFGIVNHYMKDGDVYISNIYLTK